MTKRELITESKLLSESDHLLKDKKSLMTVLVSKLFRKSRSYLEIKNFSNSIKSLMKTHHNLKSMILVFGDWSLNAFKGTTLRFLPMVRQVVAKHLLWGQPQARKFHIKTEESYQEWFKTFFRKFQIMDQNIDIL